MCTQLGPANELTCLLASILATPATIDRCRSCGSLCCLRPCTAAGSRRRACSRRQRRCNGTALAPCVCDGKIVYAGE